MRKIVTMISSLAFIAAAMLGLSDDATYTAQAARHTDGFAEYVSLENAPVIDGVIDEVWFSVSSMIETGVSADGTRGDINILWNETGLYFLAIVDDTTVNDSDRCNLWVSESKIDIADVDKVYPEVSGAWFLCINPNGYNQEYNPDSFNGKAFDMSNKYTVGTTKSEDGYIIEVYVQLTGNNALSRGNKIGFDVSIDDYLVEGTSIDDRESYVNWNGVGSYWLNPYTLGEVLLVDLDHTNGVFAIQEDPTNQLPTENNTDKNPIEPNEKKESGCGSSVVILPIVPISLLGAVLFIKRKVD